MKRSSGNAAYAVVRQYGRYGVDKPIESGPKRAIVILKVGTKRSLAGWLTLTEPMAPPVWPSPSAGAVEAQVFEAQSPAIVDGTACAKGRCATASTLDPVSESCLEVN